MQQDIVSFSSIKYIFQTAQNGTLKTVFVQFKQKKYFTKPKYFYLYEKHSKNIEKTWKSIEKALRKY